MMNFELPKNPDGSLNKNYVDLLDEDKPIAGQKFACMSFISPENILKDKKIYYRRTIVLNCSKKLNIIKNQLRKRSWITSYRRYNMKQNHVQDL